MTEPSRPSDAVGGQQVLAAMRDLLPSLLTPLLAIDLDAVSHNISAMADFAGPGRWRPHIKTVKQRAIVQRLFDAGISTLKCATLDELALILDTARASAQDVDVLLAYAPTGPMLAGAIDLARQAPRSHVRVLADQPAHLRELSSQLSRGPSNVSVMLDVDVGMARTGTCPAQWRAALPELRADDRAEMGRVRGLHGYEGHLEWTDQAAAETGYRSLTALAPLLESAAPLLLVTSGTHSFHHALKHAAFADARWEHQVSPGTLVLNDLRSDSASALLGLRQAAFALSRVISTPADDRVTLDAGSKALNPDCPPPGCALPHHPGWLAQPASEEHRPLRRVDDDAVAPALGEVVVLVPEHVCTTVNMFRDAFHVCEGQDPVRHAIEAASRRHEVPVTPR